jgi:hypothetical protein
VKESTILRLLREREALYDMHKSGVEVAAVKVALKALVQQDSP